MLHRKNPPYTIEELKEMLAKQSIGAEAKPKRRKQAASTVWMQTDANMLRNVNDDEEVRRLIHNMMEMDGGTMMKNIASMSIAMFGDKYASMQPKDWSRLINDYVRQVTNCPELKEDTLFYYKVS